MQKEQLIFNLTQEPAIKVQESWIESSRQFATLQASKTTTQALYTNTRNASFPFRNTMEGKISEIACAAYLHHRYHFPLRKPSLEVWQGYSGKFGADIKYDGIGCHIKTTTVEMANRYGLSWTIQKQDGLAHGDSHGFFFLTLLDMDKKIFIPKYLLTANKELVQSLYREPVLTKYKGQKLIIYAEDLEKLENEKPIDVCEKLTKVLK